VDRIEDAHSLTFADGSVNAMLMFEILEHLRDPRRAIDEAYRVLAGDGLLALSVPFSYRVHGFPSDYWRFTSSGIHEILSKFPNKMVFAVGPRLKPAFIFAVAGKGGRRDFEEARRLFERRVHDAYARTWRRGYVSALKERGRDFIGHLIGRSEMGVSVFDPSAAGGYVGSRSEDAQL
jgi:SAM-dependent methyltransferase